jgi:hypothetical protein
MGQVLRLGARGRADRHTYGVLFAAVAHVALGLWATGWAPFSARAWAGAELGVLPFQDVSGDSRVYVLEEGAMGATGEVGGATAGPASEGSGRSGRDIVRPSGRSRNASPARPSADATLSAAGRSVDPVPEWLRAALGSPSPGAVGAGEGGSSARVAGDGASGAAADGAESSARARDDGGQTGRSRERQPLLRGRARPATLLPNWDCEYPGPPTHDVTVRLVATVRPDGTTESVDILNDPGEGFAETARECAMRQPFSPALDKRGQRIRGKTRPFLVRFIP